MSCSGSLSAQPCRAPACSVSRPLVRVGIERLAGEPVLHHLDHLGLDHGGDEQRHEDQGDRGGQQLQLAGEDGHQDEAEDHAQQAGAGRGEHAQGQAAHGQCQVEERALAGKARGQREGADAGNGVGERG